MYIFRYSQIKDDVKFPIPAIGYTANRFGFYALKDFKDKDDIIYYYSGYGEEAVSFNRNHKCRVYYGEDLFDKGTRDNHGKHCIHVYASFYDSTLR